MASHLDVAPVGATQSSGTGVRTWIRPVGMAGLVIVLLGLALVNLTSYPTTWFDEGSHLHVPKTLVTYGVYADYSSEGFRYYGPTIGVGPTVMLPIAAAFKLFGIGLLQARLVMAAYLIAAVLAFYALARRLGSQRMALVATVLLVVTPGVALLEYGRQVLGEVPGFLFLVVALALWFGDWARIGWGRLALVGLCLGLAIITKSQYLLILAPSLGLAWLLNLVYYRAAPQRVFLVPGIIAGLCAVGWQAYLVLYLGPATAAENFALLRQASAGAAFVFSSDLMRRALSELASFKVYAGALLPALIYGFLAALPRTRRGLRWSMIWLIILVNLVWYVVASISWLRYAFLGLALSSLFVAQFFGELTDDYRLDFGRVREQWPAARGALLLWLGTMLVLFSATALRPILAPAPNDPLAMAQYLDANVSHDAVIETWEPEMGFLTDHAYHFPPPALLDVAVGYIWRGGPAPASEYDMDAAAPDYLLVGRFARWVQLYPDDLIAERYDFVTQVGDYQLFSIR